MSTWRGQALELLPELSKRVPEARDQATLWVDVQREFHSARNRGDEALPPDV